ncbi:hypothetical protein GIB67_003320, partial [Kingdonia uniflora]
ATLAGPDDLPFPENVPGLPAGVKCIDQFPSMSQFIPFANATKLLQPHFERTLGFLSSVAIIISNGFLGCTLDSAKKLNLPRLVFTGCVWDPLCLAGLARVRDLYKTEPEWVEWVQWLDARLGLEEPVLYVAFGSQAEISSEQLGDIALGLERSMVNFLWVVRSNELKLDPGFYERVKDRGLVV